MRLPRDWLGPREDLVPFGPRASSRVIDGPAPTPDAPPSTVDEPPPTAYASAPTIDHAPPTVDDAPRSADALPIAGEPPPSAEDFWGERSASIHGALQAPAGWAAPAADLAPADPATADARADLTAAACAPPDPNPTACGLLGVRTIRLRRANGRTVAAATAGLAASVAVLAVVSIFGAGATPPRAGGSKAGVAAVLSGGVSRILQLGLARIDASLGHEGATVAAQSATSRARRTPHHDQAAKPNHKSRRRPSTGPPHQIAFEVATATTTSASTYRPAGVGTSDASSAVRTNTATSIPPARSPSRSASRSLPSRATVSSTGESGALGPIHSPNG